jgi:hypothetical protein
VLNVRREGAGLGEALDDQKLIHHPTIFEVDVAKQASELIGFAHVLFQKDCLALNQFLVAVGCLKGETGYWLACCHRLGRVDAYVAKIDPATGAVNLYGVSIDNANHEGLIHGRCRWLCRCRWAGRCRGALRGGSINLADRSAIPRVFLGVSTDCPDEPNENEKGKYRATDASSPVPLRAGRCPAPVAL